MEIPDRPPSAKGPAEWFTGDVWIDTIVRGQEPSHVRVSAVRFTPGARTAWHSHAVGQTPDVTDGQGLAQSRGGGIVPLRPGDVVTIPPDEVHWHGAARTTSCPMREPGREADRPIHPRLEPLG
jgi:quercetin dioxygenase-like cupin family protein